MPEAELAVWPWRRHVAGEAALVYEWVPVEMAGAHEVRVGDAVKRLGRQCAPDGTRFGGVHLRGHHRVASNSAS
jgi:hypothetical protein